MSNVKKIKLNSSDLGRLLKEDKTINKILNDAGRGVEAALPQVVSENRARSEQKGYNSSGQTVFSRNAEKIHDRQKVEVGIENAQKSDFIYGSIQKAVKRAGGRK